MNRNTLLATVALSALTYGTAWADGGNGKQLTGLGDFGYQYQDVEYNNGFGYYQNTFHGAGSALWTWPGSLNLQGNFAFNTDRYEYDGGEKSVIDTWKAGVTAFWRDPTKGAIGGEIHYQSATWGNYADGIDIGARGEFYMPQLTLGARVGYTKFTDNGTNLGLDGWNLNAEGKYYATPGVALKLGVGAGSFDYEPSGESDTWSIDGELEYLIPDCTTSIYAGFGYEEWDYNTSDSDGWRGGVGLRVHFGTEGGDLIKRNRSEPLEVPRVRMTF